MPRLSLRRSLPFLILAVLLASPLALGAGVESGGAAAANCNGTASIDPVRAALFARCVSGSDELSRTARRSARKGDASAAVLYRGCGIEARPMPNRHAVCYAAILPLAEDTVTDK
jgi:hypothetical protein